jgi:hypothetical protein
MLQHRLSSGCPHALIANAGRQCIHWLALA